MHYVAEHTSVPIPKVHRAWHVDGRTYIMMDFVVKGIELGRKKMAVENVRLFT